jgi:hypothetical protein
MFAALVAVALAVALVLEVTGHGRAVSGLFTLAGLVFLALAIAFPRGMRFRKPPDRRSDMSEHEPHPAVAHPVHLRIRRHRGGMGAVGKANDWLATRLAVVFGVAWTIWLFFIVPLIAPYLGATAENKIFFYSSGWIQLFALPLMVYVGNKLQRSSDAQSEVIHQALTHIATVSDQNKTLIEQNTELTTQVHVLVSALPKPKTLAAKPGKGTGA